MNNDIGPQRATPKSLAAIKAEVRQLRNLMIRAYTTSEAVEHIGHAPSYTKVRHENEVLWSQLHGLIICDGYCFVRVYDPIEKIHESISLEDFAQEWVYYNGAPGGIVL